MDHFHYRENILFSEDVDLRAIAEQVGTPCYVYSRATLERHWNAFNDVLDGQDHLVCYAVKANSSLGVLNILARLGSGFDIVSQGELERVIQAGGDPSKVVFSGVGKTAIEIKRALEVGIYCFNVESRMELEKINEVAGQLKKKAPISIRVNPDVDAKTHPYISTGLKQNKFGIGIDESFEVYKIAQQLPFIQIHGVDCHIGSQLCELSPFMDAIERIIRLIEQLNGVGIEIGHIDVGGGLGISYRDETPPDPKQYAQAIRNAMQHRDVKILIEPGRAIVGNAGVLLTQVQYIKQGESKHFAIVDAAMNDLLRPALYGAWQNIIAVEQRQDSSPQCFDIVGPVCETGDFLGKDREMAIQPGDLLAVRSAGAYGFSMSSNYNSRPRAAEVMVDKNNFHVIRTRETLQDLVRGEQVLPLD